MENIEYKYKGFTYTGELEVEPEECSWVFHEVTNPRGKVIGPMNYSNHFAPTEREFAYMIESYIESGDFPSRHMSETLGKGYAK